ncbi:unnamed protein product [Microthlaspi erraticum]|uniref:Uncharacterized protein n=1 Tax=Microthlaspi erraticum TaxID=1685480 RepID=A0A6D2K688_9BRAS|nr:unnamed protein product [Microthlaspi erraticum]
MFAVVRRCFLFVRCGRVRLMVARLGRVDTGYCLPGSVRELGRALGGTDEIRARVDRGTIVPRSPVCAVECCYGLSRLDQSSLIDHNFISTHPNDESTCVGELTHLDSGKVLMKSIE